MGAVKKIKKAIKSGVIRPVRETVLRANYRCGNYEDVIWLIGAARSGTTWVSSLIGHEKRLREVFEPFNSRFDEQMSFLQPHQYMRPGESNELLEKIATDVFSGKFMHPRVDRWSRSLVYKGLLVKDVFANLLACWATQRFPRVKTVFLIRNPFPAVLSLTKKQRWYWIKDPADFLIQPTLVEDHLAPFEELIRDVSARKDTIESQILIWSILNYVPLRQFAPGQCHICFYEDVFRDPDGEILKIFKFTGQKTDAETLRLNRKLVSRASPTSGPESTLVSGTSPLTSWKNELSTRQIDSGLKILEQFGLAELYDENAMPNRAVLKEISDLSLERGIN